MEHAFILKAENICKSFSGVRVLDGVSLEVEAGKVHALMGENGAGKSTLMHILMGLFPPDEGQLYFRGKKVHFNAREALRQGLSMIHQELMLFPELNVAENIFIGREPVGRAGLLQRGEMNREAARLLAALDLHIDPRTQVRDLSVGEMQLVEIVKAVSNEASVIIMDEPTSAISQREAERLFRLIRQLRDQGKAILYISHKMDEILQIADTITVLRDGKHILTRPGEQLGMEELITHIVGRELSALYSKVPVTPGEVLLELKGLSAPGVREVSFSLRSGEVLGLAGLMGSGRTAIAHAIAGMERPTDGEILLKGRKVHISSPRAAKELGIGLVTEDRKQTGLVLNASVKRNITLPSLKKHGRGLLLDAARENAAADREMKRFRIKAASRSQEVGRLSGGNQQKVVLAGIHLNDPDVLILDEPTRGVDVGAKQEIYQYIGELAAQQKGIILISSELPEILALSDRILVVREGKIRAELTREEASQELIMTHAMS